MASLGSRGAGAAGLAAAADPEAAALAGLDSLETGNVSRHPWSPRNIWATVWPKLLAAGLVIGAWQIIHLSGWKKFVLPGPATVFANLWAQMQHVQLWQAIDITMRRAVIGFALSAPSVANGLITGVDYIPPLLLRAGKTMGLSRVALYRHLILPASLPAFVSGLKQAWAFAWRSLMAGELLVIIFGQPSIGALLSAAQDQTDMATAIAIMIVILALGIVIDMLFSKADAVIRRRRGMTDPASA